MKKETAFLQKKKDFYNYIKNQKFAGGKLPTEEVLSNTLGVCRSALREIMRDMEREGYISKKQGLGNFVHQSALNKKMRIDLLNDFHSLLKEAGFDYESNELEASERDKENIELLKREFPYEKIDDFYLHGRMYFIEGIPAIYSMLYIPKCIMLKEVGTHESLNIKGVFDYMELCCNQNIEQMIIDFDVLPADKHFASKLSVTEGYPLMQWYEVYYNFFDEAVCASISYFNPSKIKFSMLRK